MNAWSKPNTATLYGMTKVSTAGQKLCRQGGRPCQHPAPSAHTFAADALFLPLPCCCPQRMLPCYWQRARKCWGDVWAGLWGLAMGQSHCGACCPSHSPGNRNCNRKLKTLSAETCHVAPGMSQLSWSSMNQKKKTPVHPHSLSTQ